MRGFRKHNDIEGYWDGKWAERGEITLDAAAEMIGVAKMTALRMIRIGELKGRQACKGAPWVIKAEDVAAFGARKRPVNGARPARLAIWRRFNVPSSGISARKVRARGVARARKADQQLPLGTPDWRVAHQRVDIVVDLRQLLLEDLDLAGKALADTDFLGPPLALALGNERLDDLPSAADQFSQQPSVPHNTRHRLHGLDKLRDDRRIDQIVLARWPTACAKCRSGRD